MAQAERAADVSRTSELHRNLIPHHDLSNEIDLSKIKKTATEAGAMWDRQKERLPISLDWGDLGSRPTAYQRFLKPPIDFVGALALCLVTLPILLIVSAAVLVMMGRPVIYSQPRVGKNGRVFLIFKIRTMVEDRRVSKIPFSGEDRRLVHKSPNDPRVTKLGRYLRRWSLDEIPQFWNVILFHMSLVGPRPELAEVVDEKYSSWQHLRHVVKPGVTGLWQISEQKAELMLHATHIDLEYIRRMSLTTDLKILLLTPLAAFGRPQSIDIALPTESMGG